MGSGLARVGMACGALVLHLSFVSEPAAAEDLLPNLKAYPAHELNIVVGSDGRKSLRFSTLSWNNGVGPLELVAGKVNRSTKRQRVYQRIYSDRGSHRNVLAGNFVWHAAHNHFHFEGYALYTLRPAGAPTTSQRTGEKTTFCLRDTTKIDTTAGDARYATCGSKMQGITAGWGDKYAYSVIGQSFDITNLPDGQYELVIEIDPKRRLIETNDGDNVSIKPVCLIGSSVSNPPC